MDRPFKLLDVVALLGNLPEHKLRRGQVGTVVEVYDPDHCEVEFSDSHGHTYAMLALPIQQLILLHHAPAEAA